MRHRSDPAKEAARELAGFLEQLTTDSEMDVLEFCQSFAPLVKADPSPARYMASDVIACLRGGNGSRPAPLSADMPGLALRIDLE